MGDCLKSVKDVFKQSQTGMQGHGNLIRTLHKIYDKTEFNVFWSDFSHCMKYALIVFKREPAVERVIEFISKFATSLNKKLPVKDDGSADDDDDDDERDSVADNKLLKEMFDFLLEVHSAKDRAVRFRCCQLINKLLTNLGEDAQVDDELYDRLYECMLDRLKDKCPIVRYHAVLAMSRLQDPSDENCPVIRAYLFLVSCDPNPEVRRAVLTSIAPSPKTLSSIIGRSRDVKDTVRKTTYEVLSDKIHIKALSIALRLQILNEGLKDRSEMVKKTCGEKLLQAWLRTFDGNVLDLLKSLDVEDSTNICSLVLETLYKASSPQAILDGIDILDDSLLVPEDKLTCESALYWQTVCKYFHDMGNDGDEYLEKVMPSVVDYCAFKQKYVDGLKTIDDPEVQLSREFIIEQLLMITTYMDLADTASRKALETLLHNMLMADHVSHRLVKPVVTRICELKGTGDSLVTYFAEIVSEIREPITVVQKDIEEEQRRQINLKIAGIRVQLNQLREELDESVKAQDFTKAAAIKASIAELDAEKKELLETAEPVREEIRTERNDPLTILKCQTIISEMLEQLKLTSVSSTLQMMVESQIVPGIQNEVAEVRNMAMKALGLCCYKSKDLLVTYIPLFMQASQIDVEGVRVTALQVLFDLLLLYGLDIVDATDSTSTDSSDPTAEAGTDGTASTVDTETRSGTGSKLVAIMCSFLDKESSDLRTYAAEGLAKLLLSARVISSKILSHMILLWYNPLSEDDTHLRNCLGTFFPLYALASRNNQIIVEEAFLPTLRTLLNAPSTSPLAEVNVNNVAELLVQLTNTKLLTLNQNQPDATQDNPGHDNLAESVCNEILSDPESPNVKLWSRILNQMEVSPQNEMVLKDLRILSYKMVKTVKEKFSLRNLEKFQATISQLAEKYVSNDDDLENIEIDIPAPTSVESNATGSDTGENNQTPKRKRVRGLYSQNLTLELDGETELDVTEESVADVDASCLMSRTNPDTPGRRSRKNTTELADDVFTVLEVPALKKSLTTEMAALNEEKGEDGGNDEDEVDPEQEDKANDQTEKDKAAEKTVETTDITNETTEENDETTETEGTKSPRKSRSPAKSGHMSPKTPTKSKSPDAAKSVGKRKTPTPKGKDKGAKSPRKSTDGKGGKSSTKGDKSQTEGGKDKEGASPRTSSPGKRGRSPKKAGEKTGERAITSRRSSEKRKASKSPQTQPTKRMQSRDGRNESDKRKASQSPPRERKRQSKSPSVQAAKKSVSKTPLSKTSPAKSVPAKKTTKKRKAPESPRKLDVPQAKKTAVKRPSPPVSKSTVNTRPDSARAIRDKVTGKGPSKEAEKKGLGTRGKNSPMTNTNAKKTAIVPEKATKTTERPVRASATKAVDSPRTARAKSVRVSLSKNDRALADKATPKTASPRLSGQNKRSSTTVIPDLSQRRMSTRSVLETPDGQSPRPRRSAGPKQSVAETPEQLQNKESDKVRSIKKASTVRNSSPSVPIQGSPSASTRRTASKQPARTSVSSPATSTDTSPEKPIRSSARGKTAGRRIAPSSASSTDSSPEKPARSSARGRAGGTPSNVSSEESPGISKTKRVSKSAAPVMKLIEVIGDDDDVEEETLQRKARPSRRSASATSSIKRPAKSSISQKSTATASQSPRTARTVGKESSKSTRPTSRDVAKTARGGKGDSPASTISLISSQSSKASSKSTGKGSSVTGSRTLSQTSSKSSSQRSTASTSSGVRSSKRTEDKTKVTKSAAATKTPG